MTSEGIDRRLSIRPFLEYLEERSKDTQSIKSAFLRSAIDEFRKHPELLENLTLEKIMQHRHLLDLVYSTLSVSVEDEEGQLWSLCAPIMPMIFYGTDDFYNILLDEETGELKQGVLETQVEIVKHKRPELIYTLILSKLYHFENAFKTDLIRKLIDERTGLLKYYRVNFDRRFLNVIAKAPLPDLSHEKIQAILHELKPLETLYQILPVDHFIFEGFSVVTLTDVTSQFTTESIKNTIVNKSMYSGDMFYTSIVESLRSLVGNSEIHFGLLPLLKVNDKLVFNESTCLNSILICSAKCHGVAETAYMSVADNYFSNPRLLFYKTITAEDKAKQIFLKMISEDGICSYALMPIFYNNNLAGVLEVYSRKEGELNERIISLLDPAIPLVAQVLQGHIDDFNGKINNIVKEKFTSLQPAVQWKFNEAAWLYLKKSFQHKKVPEMEK